ncbi:aminodeoxychorismate lyase [Caldalkalibacillus thermarum TA2.A1]|uniref:Aminodeoxychorismate lyase n=1 Tax=Caldalkalibacillus thermarum (strain TA2.A1) TaxID=986075 RepID=F5L572_CALTT|nr:endolytic transglycosylase MltG [Caldalkalibacillus thermarum]EGL83502.1 aminodeoxychorismate lyase [Caldalkalibacillus thermarum TA2.A1]QZT33459.1 endolytic transglycosylase MltG [Caldalkalibacillus thermarum TA2.A1]
MAEEKTKKPAGEDHEAEPKAGSTKLKENEEPDDVEYLEVEAASPLKVVLVTLGVIFLLAVIVAAAGSLYLYSQLKPVNPGAQDEVVEVEIPKGSSTAQIAQILHEAGLIKNEMLFYYYVRYLGVSDFKAGQYQLSPSMSARKIIEVLQEGG